MPSALDGYDPFAPAVVADPYPHYARMREAERAPFLAPFGMHLVTRYGDAAAILRNWELFSSDERKAAVQRPRRKTSTGSTVLGSDPPDHTRLRALVTRRFGARSAAAWDADIRAIVERLVDEALKKDVIDVMRDLAVPLPVMVIAKLLGIPAGDTARFKAWSDNEIANIGPQTPPAEVERLERPSMRSGLCWSGYRSSSWLFRTRRSPTRPASSCAGSKHFRCGVLIRRRERGSPSARLRGPPGPCAAPLGARTPATGRGWIRNLLTSSLRE